MPFFSHDDIQFHYRDDLVGLPLVFQHGLGADSSQSFGLCPPLPGVRRIAFDVRSHGLTRPPGPVEKLGFATFAGDGRALLDHLGIGQAVVGGTSMGAGLALRFALDYPDRLLGLVLSRPAWLESACPWNVRMFSLITGILRVHGARRGREIFQQTQEYRETLAQWPHTAGSLLMHFETPQAEQNAFRYERIIHDCPNRDRREWAAIRAPTLILANREDPIHPFAYGEILAGAIPGSALCEVTSKSISVQRHQAEVDQAIASFLKNTFHPA